ncbi:hypothetical protein BDAP_002743 [Binucleata daphniae]
MLNNAPETCKSYVQSDIANSVELLNSTVPEMSQNDQADAQFDDVKEKEIFNNHVKQQANDKIQDIKQKIKTCKNIKKNTKNFLELTQEMKRPLYNIFVVNHKKTIEKSKKIKKLMKDKKIYTLNNFMEDDATETFKLADHMPDCITKQSCNKEAFDKQTQVIRKLIDFGRINYKKFFRVLNEEIDYNDDDKEVLAKLVDLQMNDFLHKNINSMTLLFPKMQFFMEYYNKYQDDLVFFVDIKHVCMVYGMMHILETICNAQNTW